MPTPSSTAGSPSPGREVAARLAAILLALSLLALSGIQFGRSLQSTCVQCGAVSHSGRIPLAGMIFYGPLALLLLFRKFSDRVAPAASLLGLSVHAGLAGWGLSRGSVCGVCLLALALSAALWMVCSRRRFALSTGLAAISCAGLCAGIVLASVEVRTSRYAYLSRLPQESLRPSRPDGVTMLVLEDPENPASRRFQDQWEPVLLREFGPRLTIRHASSRESGASVVPTFLVGRELSSVNIQEGEFVYSVVRGWILKHLPP